jgi:hypothetical protein
VAPVVPLLALLIVGSPAVAQDETGARDLNMMYLKGQSAYPTYEGWMQNEDGSYDMYFGYFNINWQEELDVPVGPENYFAFTEPRGLDDLSRGAYDASTSDQGQPAHFYPRRNPFLFTVRVPSDFGDQELVWTLVTNGEPHRTYGTLALTYGIDPQSISTETGGAYGSLDDRLRTNLPPKLEVEGSLRRTVRVGEPLTLIAQAEDPDNLPERRERSGRPPESVEQIYANPPGGSVVRSGPGLALSWMVYRGSAEPVVFDPVQQKTWMDTRAYANSPWSPPFIVPEVPEGHRWVTRVTFSEPGEYTLRAVARDGAIFTYENVVVTVTQ